MANIEAAVKKSGRKIGQIMAKATKKGFVTIQHVNKARSNLKKIETATKSFYQRMGMGGKGLNKQLSTLDKQRTSQFIAHEKKKLNHSLAVGAQMTKAYQSRFAFQAGLEKAATAKSIAEQKKVAAATILAQKASSSAGIYKAAGIKGSGVRIKEINALRSAQRLLHKELRAGTLTRLQYNTMMGETTKRLNLLNRGNVRARGAIHQLIARTASLTFELTGAVFGIVSLGAALASPAIMGVGFLRKMEDTKLGLTGILLAMGGVNDETLSFGQASMVAQEQIDLLAVEAMSLSGTLTDFTKSFQATLAPGLAAGMSISEIREVAVAGTVAVKTIGLDSRQVVQEIRDLVAGGIQAASSTLATSLGLTDKDIKKAKTSTEGLYRFLIDKLKGFKTAGLERDETLSGKMERTWEAFIIGLSTVSQPVFDAMLDSFDMIFDSIVKGKDEFGKIEFQPAFLANFKGFIEGLATGVTVLKDTVAWFWKWKDVISTIVKLWVGSKILKFMGVGLMNINRQLIGTVAGYKAATTALNGHVLAQQRSAALTVIGSGGGMFGGMSRSLTKFKFAAKGFFNKGLPRIIASAGRGLLALAGPIGLIGSILWGVYSIFEAQADAKKSENIIRSLSRLSKDEQKEQVKLRLANQKDKLKEVKELERQQKFTLSQTKDTPEFAGLRKILIPSLAEATRLTKFWGLEVIATKKELAELSKSTNFSDSVTRMNAALQDAKKALENTNSPFLKGISDQEKTSNLSLSLVKVEEAQRKLNAAKELEIDLSDEQKKQIADLTEHHELLTKTMAFQQKLITLRLKVKSLPKGRELDEAKDALAVEEQSQNLIGKRITLLASIIGLEQQLRDGTGKDTAQAQLANEELNLKLVETQQKLAKTTKLVDEAQAKWDDRLTKSREIAKNYTKTLEDLTIQEELELATAGMSSLQIDILKTRNKLEEERLKIAKAFDALRIKARDEVGYTGASPAELNALEREELDKLNAATEKRIANQIRLSELTTSFQQGQSEFFSSYIAKATNNAELTKQLYSDVFSTLENDMVSAFETGEWRFEEFVKAILKGILKIMIQKMIAGVIAGAIAPAGGGSQVSGGMTGGGFDSVANPSAMPGITAAKGGLFDPTGLVAFAKGGIVNSPTTFPFAKGTGLMGEAGPEAIMPLSRTTSGDLGVKVDGGGGGGGMINHISVEVNVAQDGSSTTEVDSSQSAEDMKAMGNIIGIKVREEIVQQKRPGGLLNK